MFDYFVLSKIEHEPQSFFKNIIELFPSHSMLINLDEWKIVTWKYHEFQTNDSYQKLSESELEDLKKLLKEKVKRAVEIRLRSDIEVGACLSGGIDSSAIVCLMREINHEANFKVFTASSEHKEIDETPWADIVAKHTNTNHFKVYPKREELETDLRDLIYCQDVPIWSTSTYAQYRVLKLAAENGVRVVLDGQGSDELFAGYPNYYLNYWRQLAKDLGVFKMAFESAYFKKFWSNTTFAFKRWLADYAAINLSPERQLQFRKAIHPELMVLNDDFLKTHLTRLNAGTDRIEPLNQKLLYDQGVGRLKTYLKCEDRCSMWHSVEARTPFSDDIELINLANSIGYNHKVVKTSLKNILKDSLKEVLPEPIYNRKDKKGFVTPNNLWLSQMGVLAIDLNNSLSNTYVDKRAFKKHYPFLFSNQDTADNGRLFKLIAFPLWKNTFNL